MDTFVLDKRPGRNPLRNPIKVLSLPTTCIHCHLLVQMEYTSKMEDDGSWTCPECTRTYPARWWKIKKAG